MTDGEIRKLAQDAAGIVTAGRNTEYGQPEDSFDVIAALWSGYLKARWDVSITVRGQDVARLMELMKMSRRITSPLYKEDNFVDGLGYILCEARIATKV